MNINLTQVIHNVKEAYVDLTGDTDDITYGNISTKISEIQTGGGIEATVDILTRFQFVITEE